MANFNRVIIVGNLTRDPVLRRAPSGAAVVEMRLAVNENYRDRQSGALKEITCFVDVVVWDKQAENCQQYLSKGRPILVEGRLAYDEWKNQQGETRSRLRVRADRIQFLGTAPARQDGAAERFQSAQGSGSGSASVARETSELPPPQFEAPPSQLDGGAEPPRMDGSIDDEDLPPF